MPTLADRRRQQPVHARRRASLGGSPAECQGGHSGRPGPRHRAGCPRTGAHGVPEGRQPPPLRRGSGGRGNRSDSRLLDDEPAPLRIWLPELAKIIGAKPPHRFRFYWRVCSQAKQRSSRLPRGVSNAKPKREMAERRARRSSNATGAEAKRDVKGTAMQAKASAEQHRSDRRAGMTRVCVIPSQNPVLRSVCRPSL